MHKRHARKARRRPGSRWLSGAAGRLGLCGLLTLGGCMSNQRPPPDPLLGNAPPTPPPTKSLPPPPTTPTAYVPATPAPSSSASTAALASSSSTSLDGPAPLRIGNSPSVSPASWQGQSSPAPTTLPPAAPPPPPPPTIEPVARRDPVVARGVAPYGGGRVTTFEQAQSFLAAHGVKWQRLETWGDHGEWKFSCSIPNPRSAFVSRTYEGRAADPLSSVRVVLDQIDRER